MSEKQVDGDLKKENIQQKAQKFFKQLESTLNGLNSLVEVSSKGIAVLRKLNSTVNKQRVDIITLTSRLVEIQERLDKIEQKQPEE